jgi:hypothetical protein
MDKTTQITFRLTEELKAKIEKHCALNNVPVAQYVRNLVIEDIKKKEG